MATQLLSVGYPQSILQNVIYALPSSRCLLFADAGAATFEQSADGTNFVALALTSNQAEVAGGFLRNTGAGADIVLKKM